MSCGRDCYYSNYRTKEKLEKKKSYIKMEAEENSTRDSEIGSLELASVIGFEGSIPGGLISHPGGKHVIYSLGCKIIVKNLVSSKQAFLSGHTNNISCLTCSSSGRYLASGQVTHMGFKADVIVWDFSEKSLYCRLSLHKVCVQALAISPNDKFLATLGGQDDNSVVIWDLEAKAAVCGSPAAMTSAGKVHCLAFSNFRDDLIITGGDGTLRVWELNPQIRKILPSECNLGQLKRVITCMQFSPDDQFIYCGTTTGDVLQINATTYLIHHFGPQKKKFSLGVTVVQNLPSGNILVGTGDGLVVELTGPPNFKKIRSTKLPSGITSLGLRGNVVQVLVGLATSQMYSLDFESFETSQLASSHNSGITSIVFPRASSELFATSSSDDVRVWHAATGKELLRLTVANLTCHAVEITPDGKAIITAWDDGKIRAFFPESAKPIYTIHDAHHRGVTALACTSNSRRIVSGGGEGQVRVWDVTPKGSTAMKATLKEHKGAITCIKLTANDEECVTSSTDGTCIIWDLVRFVRGQIIFANTMFQAVCYRPDECQIITAGTDRKIGYWETYDGTQIRELDGSKTHAINGMDIYDINFVTGGGDKFIKLWRYNEGEVTHVGVGHSGEVTDVKFSPDGQHIVSVSADGGILRWKFPEELHQATMPSTDGSPLQSEQGWVSQQDSVISKEMVEQEVNQEASQEASQEACQEAGLENVEQEIEQRATPKEE